MNLISNSVFIQSNSKLANFQILFVGLIAFPHQIGTFHQLSFPHSVARTSIYPSLLLKIRKQIHLAAVNTLFACNDLTDFFGLGCGCIFADSSLFIHTSFGRFIRSFFFFFTECISA